MTRAPFILLKWAVAIIIATGWGAAGAEDWPRFRGDPQFRGVAAGSLTDQLKLKWTFETDGPIKSSAVISNGSVFIGSDDGHIYAIDLAKGHKRWKYLTGGAVEAPPLVINDRLYVGAEDGIFYALHTSTGKEIWKYQTDAKILGSANGSVQAEGKYLPILVGSYDNFLHCIDATTGTNRWKYKTDNYVNGAAAIADGQAIFGGCDGDLYVVSIDQGELVSRIGLGAPIAGTAAVVDKSAYIGHYGNQFVRVDLKDNQIEWTFEDQAFPFFSSAAIGHDRIVVGSRARRVYCLGLQDGQEIWSIGVRGKVDSSPVICGDKVVIGSDDGRLYVLQLDDGKEMWSYQIGEAITSSPAVTDGMIIVGAEDGVVYAFGPR